MIERRTFIRLVLLLLVVAAVTPFFYPRHKPMLNWHTVVADGKALWHKHVTLSDLPVIGSSDEGRITLYRWQDSEGSWHFSNSPPEGIANYTTMAVDPDANLLPSTTAASRSGQNAERSTANGGNNIAGGLTIGDQTYTAEEVAEYIGSARMARDALRQHEQAEHETIAK